MAIVLNSEAGNTSSVNNEMLFVAYEATKATDPVTYVDYSYVCDVYVDSVFIERLIARPDPEFNRGIFDVSRALQPYCTYGFDASGKVVDYTARVAYQLKFGEQYGGTLYTNLLVDSSDRYAFKTYALRPFTSSAIITNGKASNMPTTVNWHKKDWLLLSYFSNVSGISDLNIDYYNSAGSNYHNEAVANSGDVSNLIRQVNLGNLLYSLTSAEYLLITGAGVTQRVNLLCSPKYTPHLLVWLNPFGAYDSQTFGMVSKKTIELTKKDYQRLNYRINASGEVSYEADNVYYGGKKGFATNGKTRLSMTSHLLNESEYTWLADLFISPEVYILLDTGKFLPVTIGQNTYEFKSYKNSRLSPLQFDVEFTDGFNSQYL